ncbi:MAG: MmcQ/YjbR family DNA-binding protein [Pseudomonadota bacterium]
MAKQDIPSTVSTLCLSFPEAAQKISHGSPCWTVRGKQFAIFSINHHGDGHVGLIVRSPPGEQQHLVSINPDVFYVPAYYGPAGWTGIELNGDVVWTDVSACTANAWRHVAPSSLANTLSEVPAVATPRKMTPEEIDPFVASRGLALLDRFRSICGALPEVSEDTQFGAPCFRVGKKSFCTLHTAHGGFAMQVRLGLERQSMLTDVDDRFSIPPYSGRHGWIQLALAARPAWAEVEALVLESYRHFATRRALKALEQGARAN